MESGSGCRLAFAVVQRRTRHYEIEQSSSVWLATN
jgi:hypothetical protein